MKNIFSCKYSGTVVAELRQLQIQNGKLYVRVYCNDCKKQALIELPSDLSNDDLLPIIHDEKLGRIKIKTT